jgi:uncharacterized OB-fold protein
MTTLPLPSIDPTSEPYWNGLKEGKLRLPRCLACGEHHFYPRVVCPSCGADRLEWNDVSGRATIYSCTTVHRAGDPLFQEETPFVVAVVELEEGPRMTVRINSTTDTVHIGDAVRLDPKHVSDDVFFPYFRIA